MSNFDLRSYLKSRALIVDRALHKVFSEKGDCPDLLWRSMKYSLFAGGKRLRPILCLAAAEAVGLPLRSALRPACALELIHTYSLIHDDLPALDDDDLRRGRKTNHVVFGEDMAILAGDGLLTLAFEGLANPRGYSAAQRRQIPGLVHELARQAGYAGMVGGQVSDIKAEKQVPTISKVLSIHRRKTGALLMSSVRLPALLKGAPQWQLRSLTDYGRSAGLAFQIVDDILNETGSTKFLGKKAGSDKRRGKMTYPSAVGLEAARSAVRHETMRSILALQGFGKKAEPLRALALYMAERTT